MSTSCPTCGQTIPDKLDITQHVDYDRIKYHIFLYDPKVHGADASIGDVYTVRLFDNEWKPIVDVVGILIEKLDIDKYKKMRPAIKLRCKYPENVNINCIYNVRIV